MSEVGAYLMIVSQLCGWGMLVTNFLSGNHSHQFVFGMFVFHWAWAWKNILFGPLHKDGGIITFGVGVTALALEQYQGRATNTSMTVAVVGCGLVALNFALPALKMSTLANRGAVLSKKFNKSEFFVEVFIKYCVASTLFWAASLVTVWQRWQLMQ